LEEDGFCICKDVLSNSQTETYRDLCAKGDYRNVKDRLLKEPSLVKAVEACVGPEYQFQDYIWIIQKSNVHTCHRDNNGDFFNEGQKHPSYTLLVYLEEMEKCLGVIPNSHSNLYANAFNITDPIKNVACRKGDAIIFNANLIHVGAMNEKEDNIRVQLKVTHRDDMEAISYYENFNKVLNQSNELPVSLRKMQKRASCMFPLVSNWTQSENIRTARGSDNGVEVGWPQQVFSYLFYGNKDFYNLPNAF
jgi:ectoine hydroxylase-related dioxygenase (phytanoyl-CoA dioxygenase family)